MVRCLEFSNHSDQFRILKKGKMKWWFWSLVCTADCFLSSVDAAVLVSRQSWLKLYHLISCRFSSSLGGSFCTFIDSRHYARMDHSIINRFWKSAFFLAAPSSIYRSSLLIRTALNKTPSLTVGAIGGALMAIFLIFWTHSEICRALNAASRGVLLKVAGLCHRLLLRFSTIAGWLCMHRGLNSWLYRRRSVAAFSYSCLAAPLSL